MMIEIFNFLGTIGITWLTGIGDFFLFLLSIFRTMLSSKLKMRQLIFQMYQIGVGSLVIVILTGFSIGLALALQTYIGLSRFGAHDFIGVIVALGMTRELGPVLTGLMVTGRSGSGIAAEIGTMQITEQVDALRTLRINPLQYLVIPRILASVLVMPFLSVFSMVCGIIGGYVYCVFVLNFTPENYLSSIRRFVEFSDIFGGLIKSSIFGLILSWVGTYYGYKTYGGARGVGLSTTRSVVVASIMILVANYLLSSFLFKAGIG